MTEIIAIIWLVGMMYATGLVWAEAMEYLQSSRKSERMLVVLILPLMIGFLWPALIGLHHAD